MLSWALKYLSLGFSVIPLRPGGKEPLYKWTEFQTRRPSMEEIVRWWTAVPNANIGIVTGAISNLAVIDLDGPEGIKEALALGLTSSIISLTGNGKHLWYKNIIGLQNSVSKVAERVDVRAEGGYVVAPPSIHESGRRYRWLNVLNVANLIPFPSVLFVENASEKENRSLVGHFNEESRSEFKPKLDIAKALQEMKLGNIDDTLFTVCSRLRADGYSMADARALLLPHALNAGAVDGHLDDKIKNVWARYEPNERKMESRQPQTTHKSEGNSLVIHSPSNPDSLKQFQEARQPVEDGAERLRTGYGKLDAMFKGGLKSSRLFTVAARTGVGKTNWLLAVAKRLCMDGKRVLLFSTEMPYSQIWERYIATLQTPTEFTKHQFYVCDSFAPNLERVEEAIKAVKPDVFMFDHINHVSEEQQELGAFMQGLNFLRRKYDCAGLVTAQLNRQADWVDIKTGEKVTPRMSMIKGSGTIEQASSRVLLLSETRVSPEGSEIVGNLDKNDNGPKGLCFFRLANNPYRMEEIG